MKEDKCLVLTTSENTKHVENLGRVWHAYLRNSKKKNLKKFFFGHVQKR